MASMGIISRKINFFMKLLAVMLLLPVTVKALPFDVIPSVSYGVYEENSQMKAAIIPELQVYVPFFYGLDAGVGISYISVKKENKTLYDNLGVIKTESIGDTTIGTIPVFMTIKYEYKINNKFSVFSNVSAGIAYADKNYYTNTNNNYSGSLCSVNRCAVNSSGTINGGGIFGAGAGFGYKNFLFAVKYDVLRLVNRYQDSYYIEVYEGNNLVSKIQDNSVSYSEKFNTKIISFKVSYVIS